MRIVAIVLAVCLLFSVYASADDLSNEMYIYELEDGYISIKGINDNSLSRKISVPADIDGVAVKIINAHTFLNTNAEEIEFTDGIEEISPYAISGCDNLKKVTIPASCKIIGGLSYMPAIEYCENLETIEIHGEYERLPLFVADCPNLKNIIFYGDVINTTNEFKYNFYKCEPRVKRVNPRIFTEPLNITIHGKHGSNIEKFANEKGFKFVSVEDEIISAWAKPEVENAIEMGFVPISLRGNYKRNITRREFAKMAFYFLSVQYGYRPEAALETWYQSENPDYAVRTENFVSAYCSVRKDRNGNVFTNKNTGEAWKYEDKHGGIYSLTLASPFSDLQAAGDGMNTAAQRAVIGENQIIDYAYNFGIINGKSDTEFDPHGEITRQEAAAMLMRVYKNYADVNIALGDTKFSDDDKISDWAKDDVYNINVLGVMQGVGEKTFAPLEGYTVEQSVATFWRLYDKAPLSRKNKNIEPLLKYSYERENFFTNVPGTSVFTAEKESPYEEYTVVRGYHRRYHRKNDYRAYVFYKYGGCLDLLSFIPISQDNSEEIEEAEVNSVENVIKFIAKVPDSFRLYNKLNGSEKVYAAGKYSFEIDLLTGNILSLIRIS